MFTEVRTPVPVDARRQVSLPGERVASERWWETFESPGLTAAVEATLADNVGLAAAWQRLQAAKAIATREAAEQKPEVTAGADAGLTTTEDDSTTRIGFELAAAYELDLWGRLDSRAAAVRLRAEASAAEYQAVAVTLSAETATVWFRLVDAGARIRLLQDQLAASNRILSLLETRLASGQSRGVDVLRQRQLVAATRQQLKDAETEQELLKHQLAVLQGQAPKATFSGADSLPEQLPGLPELPATGVPSELIQRRPDTQAAFLELQAANRDVAAAISQRYPRLAFDLSLSTVDTNGSRLFEQWALSLGSNLTAPLLDFDRRKSEVDRTQAEELRLLYAYRQTVLIAFREVEDALLREARQAGLIDDISQRVELATQTYAQLQLEYLNGLGNFIDVLRGETELQQLQRELLAARRLALEYRVALYRALAGAVDTK